MNEPGRRLIYTNSASQSIKFSYCRPPIVLICFAISQILKLSVPSECGEARRWTDKYIALGIGDYGEAHYTTLYWSIFIPTVTTWFSDVQSAFLFQVCCVLLSRTPFSVSLGIRSPVDEQDKGVGPKFCITGMPVGS